MSVVHRISDEKRAGAGRKANDACPCAVPRFSEQEVERRAASLMLGNPSWSFARARQRAYVELLLDASGVASKPPAPPNPPPVSGVNTPEKGQTE